MINFWNKTITIYNKQETANGEILWSGHILTGCFVKNEKTTRKNGSNAVIEDVTIVRIPKNKNYLEENAWAVSHTNEQFTIQNDDVIIMGVATDVIDELTKGQRMSDLLAKYKKVGSIRISSFTINTDLPNAHYKIIGV